MLKIYCGQIISTDAWTDKVISVPLLPLLLYNYSQRVLIFDEVKYADFEVNHCCVEQLYFAFIHLFE